MFSYHFQSIATENKKRNITNAVVNNITDHVAKKTKMVI
jgi:hypothetical protein